MHCHACFASSARYSFRHTVPGTLLGTYCAFLARSVQKMERERARATVFLTVASSEEIGFRRHTRRKATRIRGARMGRVLRRCGVTGAERPRDASVGRQAR